MDPYAFIKIARATASRRNAEFNQNYLQGLLAEACGLLEEALAKQGPKQQQQEPGTRQKPPR